MDPTERVRVAAAAVVLAIGLLLVVALCRKHRLRLPERAMCYTGIAIAIGALPLGWLISTTSVLPAITILLTGVLLAGLGILRIFHERSRTAGLCTDHCRNCGYNLTGNTSGQCPECGTVV